jgi:SNF family Na+-dependent transporter
VGLGNIWGFPTQVGQGGGAAFVLVYLVCVAFICAPILIAELAIGRRAQKDPVGAFSVIRPGTPWWIAGRARRARRRRHPVLLLGRSPAGRSPTSGSPRPAR